MKTYPSGEKYVPEKAEFAIFIAGDRLVLALRSNKVLPEEDAPGEYFEPITNFFGRPNQPISRIGGRNVSPTHFVIPSFIARKIVIGEAEAITVYNDTLNKLLEIKKAYEENLQELVR